MEGRAGSLFCPRCHTWPWANLLVLCVCLRNGEGRKAFVHLAWGTGDLLLFGHRQPWQHCVDLIWEHESCRNVLILFSWSFHCCLTGLLYVGHRKDPHCVALPMASGEGNMFNCCCFSSFPAVSGGSSALPGRSYHRVPCSLWLLLNESLYSTARTWGAPTTDPSHVPLSPYPAPHGALNASRWWEDFVAGRSSGVSPGVLCKGFPVLWSTSSHSFQAPSSELGSLEDKGASCCRAQ